MRYATPLRPCYSSEHRRTPAQNHRCWVKPVMQAARNLDVGTNPALRFACHLWSDLLSKSLRWFSDLVHARGTP